MATPYTIARIVDVALSSRANLVEGVSGNLLTGDSRIRIYLNRETVDITFDVTVGSNRALEAGTSAINATAGAGPVIPDDLMIETFGSAGDQISIIAVNADAAAAREGRCIVMVTEVDDVALMAFLASQGLA